MGYGIRTEDPEEIYHITTRTVDSRLWFINNKGLERLILAYLAKYIEEYEVEIYAFILMGNHYHLMAKFPNSNKAAFMQSLNSIIARLVAFKVSTYWGGKLWSRRYADQEFAKVDDEEHWFMYCALNPVISGVSRTLRDYEGYNSFSDSVSGKTRQFKLLNHAKYNAEKRWKKNIRKQDYIETYSLSYSRLPAYQELTDTEYKKLMWQKLENRRIVEIKEREAKGKGFASKDTRKKISPGAKPRQTKVTDRYGFTPNVLSLCTEARNECLRQRRAVVDKHRQASKKYRNGDLKVQFPPGTYKPPAFCRIHEGGDFKQAA